MSRPRRMFTPRSAAVRLAPLALAAAFVLSGCDSSEDRAERHFSSGLALIEQGELTQGLLELRNAVRLLPEHVEARLAIARAEQDLGRTGAAFREFLQVAEREPERFEARLALAHIALREGNWELADRHGRAAQTLRPEDEETQFIAAMLDYRDAIMEDDRPAAADAADRLGAKIDSFPENAVAWRLLIDHALAAGAEMEAGLARLEEALERRPDVRDFHELRLRVLSELRRSEALRPALFEMYEVFPNDQEVLRNLVGFLMDQGDQPAAEDVLRTRADAPDAPTEHVLQLVDFIGATRTRDEALSEVEARVAAGEGDMLRLEAARAVLRLNAGDGEAALADLTAALEEAPASDQRNDIRIDLARMSQATGSPERAREIVEEVLQADARHVEALKMQAAWLIDEDRTSEAITALRTAQGREPRDPAIALLMARAHEREGERGLAGERYALAVDLSENAPRESLLYARFLLADDRLDAAEAVLTSALRGAPENPDLVMAMGQVQVARGDWDRAQRSVWQLRAMDGDATRRAADALEAESLLRQGRTQDTVAFLESVVAEGTGEAAALAALVQTQVRQGEIEGARALLDARLAEQPEDPTLRFLDAGLMVLAGDLEGAEDTYRALLQQFPAAEAPLRVLHGLLVAQGRPEEAEALVEEVSEAVPDAVLPQLLRAARLEREFDFEGAIEVYETLYARDTSNLIFANNLASLMATHRRDDESLERAFVIARRLAGTQVPEFQDTFGWVQYRRGNYEDALRYLEPAARGLPQDPFVQFHLGMTYRALGRHAEARTQLERALEIFGGAELPQYLEAQAALESLETE